MTVIETDEHNDRVVCEVCHKEVPRSEAYVKEAGDYVYHFCGAGCFQSWKQQARSQYPPPAGHDDES